MGIGWRLWCWLFCVCVGVSLPRKHDGDSYGAADALGDFDIVDDDAGSE